MPMWSLRQWIGQALFQSAASAPARPAPQPERPSHVQAALLPFFSGATPR